MLQFLSFEHWISILFEPIHIPPTPVQIAIHKYYFIVIPLSWENASWRCWSQLTDKGENNFTLKSLLNQVHHHTFGQNVQNIFSGFLISFHGEEQAAAECW